jgi:hypothetical protein
MKRKIKKYFSFNLYVKEKIQIELEEESMTNNYQAQDVGVQHRQELKKEYIRGANEAQANLKESTDAFLDLVKDKLARAAASTTFDVEDLQDEIEKTIQFIDEFTGGNTDISDYRERDEADRLDTLSDFKEDDDIVSLMDFVRDEDDDD